MKLGDTVKYTDPDTGHVWPAIITCIEPGCTTGLVLTGSKTVSGEVRAVTIDTVVDSKTIAKAK